MLVIPKSSFTRTFKRLAFCAASLLPLIGCSDSAPSAPVTNDTGGEATLLRARPNEDRTATAGMHFLYDVSQGGSTFSYTGKERINYAVVFDPSLPGLSVENGLINGVATAPGTIVAYVRATAGALEARDTFAIEVSSIPVRVDVPNVTRHAMMQSEVNIDPTNGGVTFIDPHGTTLSFSASFAPSGSSTSSP